MICDCCGKDKSDVVLCIDPYYEDITGEEVETYLCDKCYQQAIDDI